MSKMGITPKTIPAIEHDDMRRPVMPKKRGRPKKDDEKQSVRFNRLFVDDLNF
jgi:hypothetical protein